MLAHEREVLGSGGDRGAGPPLRLVLRPRHLLRPRRLAWPRKSRRRRFPIVGQGTGDLLLHPRRGRGRARPSPRSTAAPPASTTSSTTSRRRCASGCRSTPRRWARSRRGGCPPGSRGWSPARPAVELGVDLRGASNAKAKRELGWQPRYPSWRQGFRGSARLSAPASRIAGVTDLEAAKQTLLAELREHSLVIGEVTLSSGADGRVLRRRPPRAAAARRLPRRRRADRRRRGRGGAERRRRAGDGGDPARLRGDRGPGRRGPGRLLRPQRAQGARPAALGRGPGRARRPLPRRRGHGDHRRLDRAARSSGSARRASRSPACSRSSTASPAAARGSKPPPEPPTGRWSRSTRSTPSARTVPDRRLTRRC